MPADKDIDWVMDHADVIGNGVITRCHSVCVCFRACVRACVRTCVRAYAWVMAANDADVMGNMRTGVMTRPELSKAISLWYLHHWQQSRPVPRPQTLHGKHSKHC